MPPPLPLELFASLPAAVQAYIRAIEAIVAQIPKLESRVAELESQPKLDSTNSSKPPSSDGPHVKPAPPRIPSGRKRGGQPGHARHERVILPPDEVVDHKPPRCDRCCTKLSGDDLDPIIDQVIDLPEKMRHVVHHRRHTLCCPECQARTTAAPAPEAASGFGPKLTAVTAYCSGVARMSKQTTERFFDEVCGIPISTGSISKLEAKVSAALQPIHEDARAHIEGRDVNVDETSWKEGLNKAWVWVAVTTGLTVFIIRYKRNIPSFQDLVGLNPGIVTSDRFSVYNHLGVEKRQVCWAHLRRDFQAMIDRKNAGSEIGTSLLENSDSLFMHWHLVRKKEDARETFLSETLSWLREEVKSLLERGSACSCKKTAAVCRELLKLEVSLWTFATTPGVEPTNNAAERALRHAVCWRKSSYGTDSPVGSRFVERILTAVASCRTQKRDVLDFLRQALAASKDPAQKLSLIPSGA